MPKTGHRCYCKVSIDVLCFVELMIRASEELPSLVGQRRIISIRSCRIKLVDKSQLLISHPGTIVTRPPTNSITKLCFFDTLMIDKYLLDTVHEVDQKDLMATYNTGLKSRNDHEGRTAAGRGEPLQAWEFRSQN
jgi:hypothetical protein